MSRVLAGRARAVASAALAALLALLLTVPVGVSSSSAGVSAVAGAPVPGSVTGRLPDPPGRSAVAPWGTGPAGKDSDGDRRAPDGSAPGVSAPGVSAPGVSASGVSASGVPAGNGPLGEPGVVTAWLAQSHDPASALVVVNKRRPLAPVDYVPANLDGASGVLLRAEASAAFVRLAAAADAAGVPVRARSGYRSWVDQGVTYRRWHRELGDAVADAQSARPGYSEHQTGLAVDVVTRDGCQDFGCFAGTPQAAWLAENAADHGFLVRYQPGQEAITGYSAEPWHLRYVGVEAARAVVASGARSIEEYLGLPAAPAY